MLMLHKDGVAVAPEKLDEIEVVRPRTVSDRWHGTPHGEWRRALLNAATERGLEVVGEKWGVTGEAREDLFGVIEVKGEKLVAPNVPGDFGFMIGTRHSNRTRFAHTITVGGRVFVCDNGAIVGDHVIRRLHTTGFDLAGTAREGVGIWLEKSGEVKRGIEILTEIDLKGGVGDRFVNDFLIAAAGEKSIIPWSKLGKVYDEYKKPRHAAFSARTGWSLYNAVTEVAKERPNPADQLEMIAGSRGLILDLAGRRGLLVPSAN